MDGLVRMILPQFGGQGVELLATDRALSVDGSFETILVIPVSSTVFTNADIDTPSRQVAIQMRTLDMTHMNMRITTQPRVKKTGEGETLFDHIPSDDALELRFRIEKGHLYIDVVPPGKPAVVDAYKARLTD